ncbi:HNH endonuclease [Hymenobacter sp. BT664]|uniref:HNH endonuclease n=1 Tax=Hymenobacter montanus TaxID=2771359 RepID=A0A927BAF5_9BACT|nr:NUMOD4 domain-containing protein [Hymenobacter montanus]MBD2766502.1 HNH endonuclease [Hymenobacter montanus]
MLTLPQDPFHPYLNRDLADLPGEEWRGIAGFEPNYEVSNLGRVRSVGRFYPHRQGKPVWLESRILSQTYRLDKNERTGEPTVALRVALSRDGTRHDLTVRRLVYAAFVSAELGAEVVINRDGDGWNNRVENLQLVTKSEKGKRVIARGRDTNTLATIDRSNWPKTYGGYSRRKPIARCDLNSGEVLEEYPSIAEAVRRTGWDEKSIILAAKGRWRHYHGFAWKYLQVPAAAG